MSSFFIEGLRHLFQIGTVVPSSPWMARAMTRALARFQPPRRILEVGPGTGAVTRVILSSLTEADELYLTEINPAFCAHIEGQLLRPYRAEHPGVKVELQCESITSARLTGVFDIIISSLPFYAFTPVMVREMLQRLEGLLADHGHFTYMHYAGVRLMKAPFVNGSRRSEMRRIEKLCRRQRRRTGASWEFVLLNILPSMVIHSIKPNGRVAPAWSAPAPARPEPLVTGAAARAGGT